MRGGALAGTALDREQFAEMKDLYYRMCGWDPSTGDPTAAKLAELEVAEYAWDGVRGS